MSNLFSLLVVGFLSTTAVGPSTGTTSSLHPALNTPAKTLTTMKVCTGSGESKKCTTTTYDDGANCNITMHDGAMLTTGDDC